MVQGRLIAGLVMLLTLTPGGLPRASTPVDLALVLAVDISGSIDPDEAKLQRQGYIDALMNPRVQEAIGGGPYGRVAITYVEWAGDTDQRTILNWAVLDTPASVEAFASALAEAPRSSGQWTAIGAAIDYGVAMLRNSGVEATRQVIDVSGDGVTNRGRPAEWARDQAVAAGITINGLPILNDRPNPWGGGPPADLEGYYRDSVIGGTGAFLVPARDFDAFAEAILKKLLLEISEGPKSLFPQGGGG